MDTYGHLFQGQESETVKKLRPLLNHADSCQWIHQSSDFRVSRQGPVAAAESRNDFAGLETANPIRYNHFDVDRRSQSPSAVVDRSTLEGKRTGQRPDSKSGAPQGVVGSNPMPSASCNPMKTRVSWRDEPRCLRGFLRFVAASFRTVAAALRCNLARTVTYPMRGNRPGAFSAVRQPPVTNCRERRRAEQGLYDWMPRCTSSALPTTCATAPRRPGAKARRQVSSRPTV